MLCDPPSTSRNLMVPWHTYVALPWKEPVANITWGGASHRRPEEVFSVLGELLTPPH